MLSKYVRGDGLNWYNYVGGDPVNMVDPFGLGKKPKKEDTPCDAAHNCQEVTVHGIRWGTFGLGGGLPPYLGGGGGPIIQKPANETVIVRGKRKPKKYQCPSKSYNPWREGGKKLWASQNTLAGAVWAGTSYLGGKAMGTNPKFQPGDNAIQLINAPFQVDNRAVSLGHFQVYGRGEKNGPNAKITSYTGAYVRNDSHERGHTIQAEKYGIFYLPAVATAAAFQGDKSFMEKDADLYAINCN